MHRLLAALSLIVVACSPADEVLDFSDASLQEALANATPEMRPPPSQGLHLSFGSLIPGASTQVVVTGLLPNEEVILARGMGGLGSGPCLGVAGGACLGIGVPVFQLRRFTANAAGLVNATLAIPTTLPIGIGVGLQAVAIRGTGGADSATSNPLLRVTTTHIDALDDAVAGDLVITEVMRNPGAVADSTGEWFEVFNAHGSDLDLQGLVVSDLGGSDFTVQGPLVAPANAFTVFAVQGDPALNGGVHADHTYNGFSLANGPDEIVLSFSGIEFDAVVWDDGATFPDPTGASMSLDLSGANALDNDNGALWCASESAFGDGDLGTPGAPNDACMFTPPAFEQDEDFETGDLSLFPYQLQGPTPWEIETTPGACHGGSACIRTSPFHGPDTSSDVTLALSVRDDTTVGFWLAAQTEPGEHMFRFSIDGAVMLELSGANPWAYYSFPIDATGANGADRVLQWSYERSDFFSSQHPPYNVVWIDDIDIPDFNTAPAVPTWLAPANGQLTGDDPSFAWFSDDPDLDTLTYELQVDTDPEFSAPLSTGETFGEDTQLGLADGLWYARVRAKDNSDYRWSPWSSILSVEVDSTTTDAAWSQHAGDQFALDDIDGPRIDNDVVLATDAILSSYSDAPSQYVWPHGQARDPITLSIPTPTDVAPGTSATLTVHSIGPWDPGSYTVSIDGVQVVSYNLPSSNRYCYASHDATFTIPDVSAYAADGTIDIEIDMDLLTGCTAGWRADVALSFDYYAGLPGDVTSVPIVHDLAFDGDAFWDKVSWGGTGSTTVQVLDGAGVLLPDTLIPGNAVGLTDRTVALYAVDPTVYPALQLRAALGAHDTLERWRVSGGDALVWTFDEPGRGEGWVAEDQGATPALDVSNGIATLSSTLGGLDPHLALLFDVPLPADLFSQASVLLRTSNNYIVDDVEIGWASNFGDFDPRRTFTQSVFLFQSTDIVFDLTQSTQLPQEAWEGLLDGVRIDPVETFVDQVGAPDAGWAEFEEIRLR